MGRATRRTAAHSLFSLAATPEVTLWRRDYSEMQTAPQPRCRQRLPFSVKIGKMLNPRGQGVMKTPLLNSGGEQKTRVGKGMGEGVSEPSRCQQHNFLKETWRQVVCLNQYVLLILAQQSRAEIDGVDSHVSGSPHHG